MQATRQQILDYLRIHSEVTVRELSEVLGLTPTGVRQHLMILEQERLVAAGEERGRVGRPALLYSLTPRGETSYALGYDWLANALLDEVRGTYGAAGFQQVIRGVARRMASEHSAPAAATSGAERLELACAALREHEVVADWERDGDAFLLHERTCPYPEVARQNSACCVIDVAFMRELTGMDARLVTCRVRGDQCCTYRLQPVAAR
ncbi:MAG: ArsR family transcriptional regulator [Dehalococcoidia bacterium]|nr:ArsR family transcriptional regulator [Dehalococcoidia bacterium]